MKRMLSLLSALFMLIACAQAETPVIPYYSLYPGTLDGNAWVEIPNEYESFILEMSYPFAYVSADGSMSMESTAILAYIPKNHLFRRTDADVSDFVSNARQVLGGADVTEVSTVLERYEINDLPAVRVDMTGQGYEMIWVADGGDLYFVMYPLADEAFAANMREIASTLHLVKAKTAPSCNTDDYEYTADESGVTITRYIGDKHRVAVPEEIDGKPVVALAEKAFYEAGVTWVSIPDSVRDIGDFCFSGCDRLQTLHLPQGLTELPSAMLESCFRLLDLDIPDSVLAIGEGVFWGNFYLTELRLPASLQTLAGMNFVMAHSLEKIIVPEDNACFTTLDDGAVLLGDDGKRFIHYCVNQERTSYTIPEGVESVDAFAFMDMGALTEVVVPEGVKSINAGALLHAYRLSRLTLPASAVELGGGEDGGIGQIAGSATIIAPAGSAAQAYAEQFKLKFEAAPAADKTNDSEEMK
ncbi:MAG: leucine-rich repeat protein [Clostridiales bacterium]|nr:leucine-rich repeat protein [Clostridiales bacterium]